MLNKKYLQVLRAQVLGYAVKRREVIKIAGDAQHHAKRAIFAFQRDDKEAGEESLRLANGLLLELNKKFKGDKALFDEGSYLAATEEYVESYLFHQFWQGKELGKIVGLIVDADSYIGGLCDLPGELYRYAIKSATAKNFAMAEKCYKVSEEIIGELMDMDLTGYNRNKFDQAKQALHKLEQVVYEVSLRK